MHRQCTVKMTTPLPALDKNQVHVWTVQLETDKAEAAHHACLLSAEETSRAERIRVPEAKQRFIIARASLRRILALYTNGDAAALGFEYGQAGKPHLGKNSGLQFNLSYSHRMAKVAVAMHRAVGIDIQAIAQVSDAESVARLVFSPAEISGLLSRPAHERQLAFTQTWVRKEAYIKALGTGFSRHAHPFCVSQAAGDTDALCSDENNRLATAEWRLMQIEAPDGYCAALAAAGRDWHHIEIESDILHGA